MFPHRCRLFTVAFACLTACFGSNTANGLPLLQTTYNSQNSTEPSEVQNNSKVAPISQDGPENVPPEVLKAIYPHRASTRNSNQTPSFFEQPTSAIHHELNSVATPPRFNEGLVVRDETRIASQEIQQQQQQRIQAQPASGDSGHDRTGIRRLLEEPLSARVEQPTGQSRDVQVDPALIRASHALPEIVDRRTDLKMNSFADTGHELESPRIKETDSQSDFHTVPAENMTSIGNARSLPSTSPSLSEILEESNRQIRPQQKGSRDREKSVSKRSAFPSEHGGGGIELGRKIQEISVGLCIVLAFGVGFILLARLWFKNKNQGSQEKGSGKSDAPQSLSKINVTTSLRLDSKSTLHLVEAANQRVLVATDLNGIKSVVALTPSFETELGLMDAAENRPSSTIERKAAPDDDFNETYSPVPRRYTLGKKLETRDQYPSTSDSRENKPKKSEPELEIEMRRQLAELLGGQAFRDVFMQQSGSGKR